MVMNSDSRKKKSRARLFFLIILWLFLSGQIIVYKQYSYDRIGFYSSRIDDALYRVTFSAPEEETFRKLSDFLLLSCAEVALKARYRYFVVKESYYNDDTYGVGLRDKNFSEKDKTRYRQVFKGHLRNTLTYVIRCFKDDPGEGETGVYDAAAAARQIRETYKIKGK